MTNDIIMGIMMKNCDKCCLYSRWCRSFVLPDFAEGAILRNFMSGCTAHLWENREAAQEKRGRTGQTEGDGLQNHPSV